MYQKNITFERSYEPHNSSENYQIFEQIEEEQIQDLNQNYDEYPNSIQQQMNIRSSKYLTQKSTNCLNSDRNPNKSTKQKSVTPKFYPTSIITSPPAFPHSQEQGLRKNKSQDLVDQKQGTVQKKLTKKSPISSIHNLVKQKSNLSGYFPLRQPQNYSLTINRKSTQNSIDPKRSYSKDSAADIKNAIELKKYQQNGPLPNLLTTELRKYMQKKDQSDVSKSQKKSKSKVKIVNGKYVKISDQKSDLAKSVKQFKNQEQFDKSASNNLKSLKDKDQDLKMRQASNKRLNLEKKSRKVSECKKKKKSRSRSQKKRSTKGHHSYSKVSAQSDFNNNYLHKSNRCLSINFLNRNQNQFFNQKANENASFGKKIKSKFSEGPQIEHIMVSPSKKSCKAKSNLSKSNKSPLFDNTSKSLNLTKNFIENYTTSRVPSKMKRKLKKSISKSQKTTQKAKSGKKSVKKSISQKKEMCTSPQAQKKSKSKKKQKKSKSKSKSKKQQKNSISQWVKIIQSGNPVMIKKKSNSLSKQKNSVKTSTQKKRKSSKKKRKSSSNNKIKKNAEKLMQARKNIKSRSKIIEKIKQSFKNLPQQSNSFQNEIKKAENMFTIPQMTSEPQICNILQQYSPNGSNQYFQSKSCTAKNIVPSGLSNIVENPYNTDYTIQFGQNSILKTESSHGTLKVDNYQINEDRAGFFPIVQNQFKGSEQSSSIFNSSIEKQTQNQLLSYQNRFDHQNQQAFHQEDFKNNNLQQDQQKQIQKSFSQIVSHRTLRSKGDHSTFSLSNRDKKNLNQKKKKQKNQSLSLKKKKCKSQKKSRSSNNRLTKKSSNNFIIGSNENISPYVVSTFRGGQIQTIPQNNDNNYFQTYQPQVEKTQLYEARNFNNASLKSASNLMDQSINQRPLNYSYSRDGQRLFKGNEDIGLNSDIKEKNQQLSFEIQRQKYQQYMQLQQQMSEKREMKEKIKIQLQVEAQNQMKEINIKQENRFQKLKEQMKESLFEIKKTKARLDQGTQFSSIENKTTKRNNSSDSISEKSKKKCTFKNYVNKFTERIDLQMKQNHESEINKYKDKRLKLQILKERASKIIEKQSKQDIQDNQQSENKNMNKDLQEDQNQEIQKSIDQRIKDKYEELNQLKTIKYQQKLIEHTEKQLNYLNQQNINRLINKSFDESRNINNYINKKLVENLLFSARISQKQSQRSKQRNSSKQHRNQMSFSKFSGNESLSQMYLNEQKKAKNEINHTQLNRYKDVQKDLQNSMTRNGPQLNLTTGERQSKKDNFIYKRSQIDSLKPQESIKLSINNSKKQDIITKNSQKSLHSSSKKRKSKISISSNKKSTKQKTPKSQKKIFSNIRKISQKKSRIQPQAFQTDVMNSKNSTIVHQCKASEAASSRPNQDDYQTQKSHQNRKLDHYKHYADQKLNIQDQEKKLRFEDARRQHELVSMKGSCSYTSARSGMPFNIKTPYGMTGEINQNSQIQSDCYRQQNFKNNESKFNDAYSYQKKQQNYQPKQKVNSILKNSSAQLGMNSQASNLSWTNLEEAPSSNQIDYNQIQKLKKKLCPQSASASSQESDSDYELGFAPKAWVIRKI